MDAMWSLVKAIPTTIYYLLRPSSWVYVYRVVNSTLPVEDFLAETPKPHVVVLGGCEEDANGPTSVESFCSDSRRWTRLPNMLRGHEGGGAVVKDGQIIVVGGMGTNGEWELMVEVYTHSEKEKKWEQLCELPSGRRDAGVVMYEGKLVVLGGRGESGFAESIAYDFATKKWDTFPAMTTPRSGFAACVVQDQLIVAGGLTSEGIVASVEAFDPEKEEWEPLPSMGVARLKPAVAIVDDKMIIIGGFLAKHLNSVEAYVPETQQWWDRPELRVARSGCGAVALGKVLMVCGGDTFGGAMGRTMECCIAGMAGPWKWGRMPNMIENHINPMVVALEPLTARKAWYVRKCDSEYSLGAGIAALRSRKVKARKNADAHAKGAGKYELL